MSSSLLFDVMEFFFYMNASEKLQKVNVNSVPSWMKLLTSVLRGRVWTRCRNITCFVIAGNTEASSLRVLSVWLRGLSRCRRCPSMETPQERADKSSNLLQMEAKKEFNEFTGGQTPTPTDRQPPWQTWTTWQVRTDFPLISADDGSEPSGTRAEFDGGASAEVLWLIIKLRLNSVLKTRLFCQM